MTNWRQHHFCFCFIRNKVAVSQMTQRSGKDCVDAMDSQTDSVEPAGLSSDDQHIILPQVQYLQYFFKPLLDLHLHVTPQAIS